MRGARGMWTHGTEPPGCLAARTVPNVATAGRDARWADHGRCAAGNGPGCCTETDYPLVETGGGARARTSCETWCRAQPPPPMMSCCRRWTSAPPRYDSAEPNKPRCERPPERCDRAVGGCSAPSRALLSSRATSTVPGMPATATQESARSPSTTVGVPASPSWSILMCTRARSCRSCVTRRSR